jgi:hypothetical protein
MDVQQYAKVHPTFPHETTANQFFDEPQFESYRNLGFHAVTEIASSVTPGAPNGSTLADFMQAAESYVTSTHF